ncbi:ferric reductase domain-containing protein transmembrane component domain [Mizugakiibacter sediminis]|uniref:Protein-methionine-sulfoxide reductase heme-binding subunit MsrQ n=1 Tax=Mizugakiibacter sediminis TaxID=1475481 RepID=A0A0K8QQH6_9GAMM|nr:protein-methionine-sulfoxide reductase heme-binding subunit MsrQ [Mizugakiibacter sediminis]GAP66991.1 ferric reductase domain-containing protein transmembrane component domain [Mizugakiibacter sediminis]
MATRGRDWVAWSKPPLFALCLLPLALLAWDATRGSLGPDPVAQLEHRSGDWALRLLLATLAVTPLRRLTGVAKLVRYRRMLGLFAFFYVCAHLAIYLLIDLGGYWTQLFDEIAKKPYITAGFAAWLLLIPLAATSTQRMMKRLGRRWQQLHRLVYAVPLLGVLHYAWMVKSGNVIAHRAPLYYGASFAALMLWRVPWARLRGGLRTLRAGTAAATRCPTPAARR